MKLVYKANGIEVKTGDKIKYRHHNAAKTEPFQTLIISYIEKPKHGGSTGRVYASPDGKGGHGVFPSVYDMEWIERDDQ